MRLLQLLNSAMQRHAKMVAVAAMTPIAHAKLATLEQSVMVTTCIQLFFHHVLCNVNCICFSTVDYR